MSEIDNPMPRALRMALAVAVDAHFEQVDKSGYPYICHPVAVMRFMKTDFEKICALLHDVVEDTPMTLAEIKKGFGSEIAHVVDCLTKRETELYESYIGRVCQNKTACIVKLADIEDNLDPRRRLENNDGLIARYNWAKKQVRDTLEVQHCKKRRT